MASISSPNVEEIVEPDDSSVLPKCSAKLEEVDERFDSCGVLGVLLVDAEFLREIERRNGDAARLKAFRALGTLVQEVTAGRIQDCDIAMTGEVGRSEIWIVFFRDGGDSDLYRRELPSISRALHEAVGRNAGKAFYPFLRRSPRIDIGSAIALRNPRFSTETQLYRAVEEARRDAELNHRIHRRDRRNRFQEVLLDRTIYSVFEPIVEVSSRVVFGYESLVRGPAGSEFESPLELFGAAAEEDMVFELDCLCRTSGLKGAVDFPAGTKLFLNILPTAFHDPHFRADRLIKTLEECQLSPTDVVFEISEQESIDDFNSYKEARDYYRSLGFQFALDDTGSGYAGLEALLETSPEYIKMDRAFVSGVDQDAARQDLLSTLLTLAEKMGSKVIGEGLDTIEELEMLGKLGIHFGQGWLFGRPTPLRARI